MLSVEDIEVFYGLVPALHRVRLDVEAGETVCLLGPNGAGKTTTVKSIVGLLKPRAGNIRFNEVDITGLPPHRTVGLGLSLAPEGRLLFPDMSVDENLELGAAPPRARARMGETKARVYAVFPRLAQRRRQPAGSLSGGEQQMVAIGRALMARPDLLILDEPSLGLSPIMVQELFRVLKTLKPPTNAVVLSLDEKTQIQALSRTQPLLPLRPGLPARQTHDYRRNGLTSLYAALEIASGRVIGECAPRHTGADFLRFMKHVAHRYRGRALHVVLDNSSTHSTPAVQAWLTTHPNVEFHFTPKGASWLNMVEAWFGVLTRKSVRRGSFDTVRALIRHIEAYIADWNSHPTPFVWTKDPAAIVKKALGRGRY